MSVDYSAVGGIGIVLADEMIEKLNIYDDDYYGSPSEFFEDKFDCSKYVSFFEAGEGAYDGERVYCLLVSGETLDDINNNSSKFLLDVNAILKTNFTQQDLKVISELYVN